MTAGQSTPAPVSTDVSASLPYGVSLSIPADWTRQDVLTSGVRDYGTTTINIANFYSPSAITGDQASFTSLKGRCRPEPRSGLREVLQQRDPGRGKDLRQSDNSGGPRVCSTGYPAKNRTDLDFQSVEVKGTYIFTSTENGMYIFAFRVQNKPQAVRAFQSEIVDIYKSIRIDPPAR